LWVASEIAIDIIAHSRSAGSTTGPTSHACKEIPIFSHTDSQRSTHNGALVVKLNTPMSALHIDSQYVEVYSAP